jgi:hypothetical protein
MIDDDDCGAICGIKIGRETRSTLRKPAPVPLYPPQIPHDQSRARTPGRRIPILTPITGLLHRAAFSCHLIQIEDGPEMEQLHHMTQLNARS